MTIEKLIERIENYYDFECTGGPLRNCSEWQQLKRQVADQPAAPVDASSWDERYPFRSERFR